MSTRETPFDHSIAAIVPVEEAVLGGFLLAEDPERLRIELGLEVDDFVHWPNRVVFHAINGLLDSHKPLDPITLEHAITLTGKAEAVGGMSRIGELVIRGCRTDVVFELAREIKQAASNRKAIMALADALERAQRWPHEADELLSETRGELERLEAERRTRRTYHTVRDVADDMREFAKRPWVPFGLGGEVIDALPVGESMFLMGPTGSGKSTLAFAIAANHARNVGPSLVVSKELSEVVAAARIGAMESQLYWADVLRGPATEAAITKLLEMPRLTFIDTKRASFTGVQRALSELKIDFPDQPIMLVVDYVQLLRVDGKDMRARVADAIEMLREIVQVNLVVGLMLSQMSRDKASGARKGERLGADSIDGGAESSAIEHAAAITAQIGKQTPLAADGSRDVQLSIGKGRYGGADRVIELRQWGATGFTRILRDQPASEVRETEQRLRDEATLSRYRAEIMEVADRAREPMTREELRKEAAVRGKEAGQAIRSLIASGRLVEVATKRAGSSHWLIWTPERAAAAGLSARRREQGDKD